MSIKEIFDEISLSVIQFLENHQGVSNVQFYELGPIANPDGMNAWAARNTPFELPDDFKSFLLISDGLLLKWSIVLSSTNTVQIRQKVAKAQCSDDENDDEDAPPQTISTGAPTSSSTIPLGKMHINSLNEVVFIEDEKFIAYCLDSGSNDGRVAFVYCTDKKDVNKNTMTTLNPSTFLTSNKPQVWFQDLACQWHFIANSFTEYFRLMIMHLGLPHWQYAFTTIGLDPISKQWFRFLSPERLAIDLEHMQKRLEGVPTTANSSDDESHKKKRRKRKGAKLNLKKVAMALKISERKQSLQSQVSITASKGKTQNKPLAKK